MNALPYPLLHNMSAPPKSVVKYEGLPQTTMNCRSEAPVAYGAAKGGPENQLISSLQCVSLFGLQIRFTLDESWRALSPLQILERLEIAANPAMDPLKQLTGLINQRAAKLPLPDGCAVIKSLELHRVIWPDPLTALTIFSKCTESVWLRNKTPSLIVAARMTSVSLLIPPSFISRLPE